MKKKASWKVWPLIGRRKAPADRSGTSPVFTGDMPPVEVSEDDREIRIRAETPGMKDSEIRASFIDGVLVIQGEKREDREETASERWFRESWYGSFERRIPLGPEADLEQVRATYRDGVLRISIPKREIPRRVVPLQEG